MSTFITLCLGVIDKNLKAPLNPPEGGKIYVGKWS